MKARGLTHRFPGRIVALLLQGHLVFGVAVDALGVRWCADHRASTESSRHDDCSSSMASMPGMDVAAMEHHDGAQPFAAPEEGSSDDSACVCTDECPGCTDGAERFGVSGTDAITSDLPEELAETRGSVESRARFRFLLPYATAPPLSITV